MSGLSDELPFVGLEYFQASCYQGLMPIRDTDISYLYSVDDQRMYKEIAAPSEVKREYYLSDAMEEEALLPKTERRTFCSKARGKVIALHSRVTPTGQSTTTKWEYYAHGSEREARLVPVYSGAKFTVEEVSFYVYDHLGNTRLSYIPRFRAGTSVVQDSIITVTDYYPYGKVLREYINSSQGQERYLTTQHERDKETGLDYRGARYYDCDVARFLSLDPLATVFPEWSAYNYVFDNPIIYLDPTGRSPENSEGTEDPGENEQKKTGWTENHAYLNEVFGDSYGFNSLIEPHISPQSKSNVQSTLSSMMNDPVNTSYDSKDRKNLSTQFDGYTSMVKTKQSKDGKYHLFELETGYLARANGAPKEGTMLMEKTSISVTRKVNGKWTKAEVEAIKLTFSYGIGFLDRGNSKLYNEVYISENKAYLKNEDGSMRWAFKLEF